MRYIKQFSAIGMQDVASVGGKNASLGEMIANVTGRGIRVPQGFAVTAQAYWYYLTHNQIDQVMAEKLADLEAHFSTEKVHTTGQAIRTLIVQGTIPQDLAQEIEQAYKGLSALYNVRACDVAVRSSATAEDLPGASFAGQQETFLHVKGIDEVCTRYKECLASLFTDRAIMYRREKGFDHTRIGLSVGIQKMVRADRASSGVMFTLDPETGFKQVITINGSWGLGESVVQGMVTPDEWVVHKPTLEQGYRSIIGKKLGDKLLKIGIRNRSVATIKTPKTERRHFCLSDDEVLTLAQYACTIEDYYSERNGIWMPMDIEWAKDAHDGLLYIVQARPETVHALDRSMTTTYAITTPLADRIVLAQGQSVGTQCAQGKVRKAVSLQELFAFNDGDILVTDMTDPDWVPFMKKASAILTQRGGRTSHAAIVSRELGIPAIVGIPRVLDVIAQADEITIDCSQGQVGYVYKGLLPIERTQISGLPQVDISAKIMVNCAYPERAFVQAQLPTDGVGLARTEFIINNAIGIHPMAFVHPEKITDKKTLRTITERSSAYATPRDFFIDSLAYGVGMIAAAFYPRQVIVRFSDFKSNEYRNLIAGSYFEPVEENPMLGLRGVSRYYNALYREAFALECAALKKVRDSMGLVNVAIMIPFVRTVTEACTVIEIMASNALVRGDSNLKLYMMCEIPSNVVILEDFAPFFDGFSIGSNDLTQTTLAVDRDSELLASLFNEQDPAVRYMLLMAIEKAKKCGKFIGICGQAPSDYPELAALLVEKGIDSLSLNPDAVVPFLHSINQKDRCR